jgi:hypothetical protein
MYGDIRTCIKCKNKADIVEKGKDFCASCYFKYYCGETIEEYENKNKELEIERFRINYSKKKK